MPTDTESAKILIVEDETLIAEDLAIRLNRLGYDICGKAPSVTKALDLVKEHHPDLVIMDIALEGPMDGIEAAEKIREQWDIPVVFLTGDSNTDQVKRAGLAHPFGYLLKPFQDRDLRINVEMALYVAHADKERRKAEQALQESEAKYRLLADNARDIIWIRDMDLNLTYVSPSTERVRGYTPEEAINQRIDEILTPESAKLAFETYSRMMRQAEDAGDHPEEYSMDLEHRCKDGDTIWLEVRISYLRDTDGTPIGILGVSRDITERKNAMETLEYERDMNERVMETSPAGIVRIDAKGNVVYANKRAEEILGIRLSEDLQRTYDDPAWKVTRFNGEPFPSENLPFNIVRKTGQPMFGAEHAIEWPNGRRVLLIVNAAPLFNPSGEFEGVVASIEDITEQWKTREEYETLFREMLDGFALHEIICDSAGTPVDYRFLAVNPAFERMTGLKGSDIIGKTVLEILPGTESYWIETYGKVALTGEPFYFENYHQGLDKYFEVTAYRPAPNQFACIFTDITDRKRAEDELKKSEERFTQFMKNFPGVAFIKDSHGRYVYANRAYDTENDPSPEARIGRTDQEIFPPEIADLYTQNDQLVFESRKPVEVLEKAFQDGNVRHQIVNKFPIEHGDGQIFIGGLTLDITERILAEEEREKLQDQLQQAQKMEAVGTLAGGIAHDFNNLLQAVNGYAQLLLMDKTEDDPDYANLSAILEVGIRASNLVRQLLLFSRKADTERKPVSLNHEIDQALKLLERAIPKMVDIQVHTAGRLWTISADAVQIEQIVLNLGINAADAMPDGGKLLIETENVTLDEDYANSHLDAVPGRYVLLTVSDTGHGMDKETVEKIFEPFFTTKGVGKGTGLGLSSVYGIVKNHGGYINCYSEVGQGTVFKIFLPAMDYLGGDERTTVSASPQVGGAETILLVDDDESVSDFASKALTKFGYTVLIAKSGEEALDIFSGKSKEIDLVLLDIGMPGMGGHKCLVNLLKIDPAAKVIIASGYSINGQVKKTMQAGASAYVGKPYQLHDLLENVRAVLDQKA
jgi:PAS domain S-box-containing protein